MITEEELNHYREQDIWVRVVRDINPDNDVKGHVVAWDENSVLLRKQNRRVVTLSRKYHYQPYAELRNHPEWT